MRMLAFTPAYAAIAVFLKDHALFFFFSTGEESSQPTKHANKITISIFLIMKATILETQGMYWLQLSITNNEG